MSFANFRLTFTNVSPGWVLILWLCCAGQVLGQQNEPRERATRPSGAFSTDMPTIDTENGYLFVNGQYVPTPYRIEFFSDSIKINGTVYGEDAFNLSRQSSQNSSFGRYGGRGKFRNSEAGPLDPLQRFAMQLGDLRSDGAMLLTVSKPPVAIAPGQTTFEFLQLATADDPAAIDDLDINALITKGPDRETWEARIRGLKYTDQFEERASEHIERIESVKRSNYYATQANRWTARLQLPLTIFAFLLVVVALGNLMTSSQAVFASAAQKQATPESKDAWLSANRKNTITLLSIAGLMSLLDLVWTVLAYQTGATRELNPLGSQLIENGLTLFIVKLTITAIAISLLYWLRQYPLARRTIWWGCLTFTLLTARWLTFNSLFI